LRIRVFSDLNGCIFLGYGQRGWRSEAVAGDRVSPVEKKGNGESHLGLESIVELPSGAAPC